MSASRTKLPRHTTLVTGLLSIGLISGCASLEPHYQFRSTGGDAELQLLTQPTTEQLQSQCALRITTWSDGLQASCSGFSR